MARGKRPVPFRTRKLSLSAPMVLPWRRGGRVGRRRTFFGVGPFREGWPFAFLYAGSAGEFGWMTVAGSREAARVAGAGDHRGTRDAAILATGAAGHAQTGLSTRSCPT